jgi:formylglycine-generating enzyme required for sulfatase activity
MEAAAGGLKGRVYPWGEAWQDGICNTVEVGLGVTSPVGLFPRARQADRAIDDLVGNVQQWCASDLDAEHGDLCPLRGASWQQGQDEASASVVTDRGNRFDDTGFRVVCRPPLGTDH